MSGHDITITVNDTDEQFTVGSRTLLVHALRDELAAAAGHAQKDVEGERLNSDVYASGAFRAEVLPTYVERAVKNAVEQFSTSIQI